MLPNGNNEQSENSHIRLVRDSETKHEISSSTKSDLLPETKEIKDASYEILWGSIRSMIKTISEQKNETEVKSVDNSFLEKYIDKLSSDQYELKNDIRDSEARISTAIRESEARNEKRIESLQTIILSSNNALRDEVKNMSNENNELKVNFLKETDAFKNHLNSNNKWLLGIMISFILSVAAMILSVVLFLSNNNIVGS